jgi:FMN-dependent NADH-azoreductase
MDYKNKVGDLFLKKFKKSGAKDQRELLELYNEANPVDDKLLNRSKVKPQDSNETLIEKDRREEYRNLIKKKSQATKARTA